MLDKMIDFIEKENLICIGDHVAVGLSGGPDSIALLHGLMALRESWSINLSAVHIDHGLRSSSGDEADFVIGLCERWDIPVKKVKVDLKQERYKGMSTEERARQARYEVFEAYCRDNKCLMALGHHRNDQAETVLLNLFRGSGLKGLKGMLPRRDFYIRPLLNVGKDEIMAYCDGLELPFVLDESNTDPLYRRNLIRHDILPLIESRLQPGIVKGLAKTAALAREEDAYMEEQTTEALLSLDVQVSQSRISFSRSQFQKQPPVIQRRVLRRLIEQGAGSLRNLTYEHVDGMRTFIKEGATGKLMDMPGTWQIRLSYDQAVLETQGDNTRVQVVDCWSVNLEHKDIDKGVSYGPVFFRKKVLEKGISIPKNVCTKWFDYDKIGTNLVLRTRHPGDYILFEKDGFKKKLKDYFIDSKIPVDERDRILLLTKGQEVIWIIGYRISGAYKVGSQTTTVLEAVINKEDLNEW